MTMTHSFPNCRFNSTLARSSCLEAVLRERVAMIDLHALRGENGHIFNRFLADQTAELAKPADVGIPRSRRLWLCETWNSMSRVYLLWSGLKLAENEFKDRRHPAERA
jgi:hypothetical protein